MFKFTLRCTILKIIDGKLFLINKVDMPQSHIHLINLHE